MLKVFRGAASFHTAAVLRATSHGQVAKKRHIQQKEERRAAEAANRPSVVLGTRSSDEETLWAQCDLAKCLVNSRVLNGPPQAEPDALDYPKDTNYGVGPVEKEMLFEELPTLSATLPLEARSSHFTASFDSNMPKLTLEDQQRILNTATEQESAKLLAFSKIIDLRNANAKGIAYENRKRIILEFSDPKNPYDPGRSEVQAALLTYEIRNLWNHLTTFKRDVGNRRGLGKLVHKRAKILKYLKKKNPDRFEALLPRLAIEPASFEGELVV